MTTLVLTKFASLEAAYAKLLGATTGRELASRATEDTLEAFPPQAWCRSQEANVAVLDRLKQDPRWSAYVTQFARAEGLERERLEDLISQVFIMSWGRRLAALRLCMTFVDRPVRLVSDLPRKVIAAVVPEFSGELIESPALSLPLRATLAVESMGRLFARHAIRLWRLLSLRRLPSGHGGEHVAWLGALPNETSGTDSGRLNLIEFLREGLEHFPAVSLVVQGVAASKVPALTTDGGMKIHARRYLPPLRFRPDWISVVDVLAAQCRQAVRDLVRAYDFRHTTLLAAAIFDLPALRFWFRIDPPRAVMYANHQIGGESPTALLRQVPATMVFYSANVAYRPENINAPGTRLEPEMRYIVAHRLTMWSPEMTGAFRTAGYSGNVLVETGPIFFGRQGVFHPTSRYVTGRRTGPLRVGIFDVAVLRPEQRFLEGLGLLTYNAKARERFFYDVFSVARQLFGDEVVIVRKMKRDRHPIFSDDLDFARLPPVRIEAHDPGESLWRVLEQVDLVVCMPFTSVAYQADECGIPAAYYDGGQRAEPSPLGGRVPLVSSVEQLTEWMRAPAVPQSRLPHRVASSVLAAALGKRAADGSTSFGRLDTDVVHT